jgi:hypothetical protein
MVLVASPNAPRIRTKNDPGHDVTGQRRSRQAIAFQDRSTELRITGLVIIHAHATTRGETTAAPNLSHRELLRYFVHR